MTSPNAESSIAAPLGAAALALLLLVLMKLARRPLACLLVSVLIGTLLLAGCGGKHDATDAGAQARERVWTVICGLPQQDNPILALLPGGYTGLWFGDPHSGHLGVKTLNRPHPESGLSTEMWLLSRSVGWWKLKAIRVHPDDLPKLTESAVEDGSQPGIRQIIDSPFLSRPAVVRAGDTDGEELVNGQILALLPDASRLRCVSRSDGSDAARVSAAQRALTRHGHDPGPVDGRMGPRTRATLLAFHKMSAHDTASRTPTMYSPSKGGAG